MLHLLLLVFFASTEQSSAPADAAVVRPATQITGRVIGSDGKPLPRVRITSEAKLLATSGADGSFAIAGAPKSLDFALPSYATRSIIVPRSLAIGDVRLLRASSISVDTAKVRDVRELSIVRYEARRDEHAATTKPVTKRVTTFTNLEQGDYLVTARGKGPLHQKARVVRVAEGGSERITLEVDQMPIRGYVFHGREPLAGATVEISGPGAAWQGTLRTNAEGYYEAELWQVGPMQAMITADELATEFTAGNRVADALERGVVEWDIVIPDRLIHGQVLDAETGAPVAHAAVSIEAGDADIHSRINLRADANGAYRYGGAMTGRYTIDVDSKDYLKPATIEFELRDGDPGRRIDIKLARGADVVVRVRREDGSPIAGAVVADSLIEDGSRPVARYRTSDNGEAIVRARAGEAKTLYVIPPAGSFAFEHVTIDAEALAKGIDVVVPEARSALVIRTRDEKGMAMENIRFLVRYNGELVPPAILSLMRHVQQVDYRTTAAGEARINGLPSGLYELWAYRTPHEADRLAANPEGYQPSLEVAIAVGTYEADLTFGR
ncbi:MAG TPA: carboxypeptidase-like regulatory domain-containing protein [Thermoanaerobaculia bacterium]